MNDKLNKVIATGLLATMIANFSACNSLPNSNNPSGSNNNGLGDTTTETVSQKPRPEDNPYYKSPFDFKGDVWQAMLDNGKAYVKYDPVMNPNINYRPLPLRFLQEQGLVSFDKNNMAQVQGNQPETLYDPLTAEVFIDSNTDENDVYVLVNYHSKRMIYDVDKDVYVVTWKLKYTLDDDDYETLLKLKGDYRQRFFIQEMDNIYQPEVLSKSVVAQWIVALGSPFREDRQKDNKFPNVYVDSVDYDNNVVTYVARTEDGYAYYTSGLYETLAYEKSLSLYNLTPEEIEQYVRIETTQTPYGKCLLGRFITDYSANLTNDQAREAVKNSTRVHYLDSLYANSVEFNFNLGN